MIPFLPALAMLLLPERGTVTLKGARFAAEVALTDTERMYGLMGRDDLTKDRCMFFVYDTDGMRGIWMKNCLISLDVLWINAAGTVVEIAENVPPCSPMRGDDCPTYGGSVQSRYWIEFVAGTVKRLGVRKGDRVSWDLKLADGRRLTGGTPAPRKP